MRCPLIYGSYSRVTESRTLLDRFINFRSTLPLHVRQRYFARTPSLCRVFSQSASPEKHLQSDNLPPKIEFNSIVILEKTIQRTLLEAKSPPSEAEVLLALQACQSYAAFRLQTSSNTPTGASPTSILLSLDESRMVQALKDSSSSLSLPSSHENVSGLEKFGSLVSPAEAALGSSKTNLPRDLESLTDLAYKIISHPDIFITIPVLASYVSLQSLIRDPSPIPAAFSLYANKPYTPPGSSKPRYPNPKQVKYAIPSNIASTALDAAIKARDMSICLDIIDTSYGAPAFQRAKLVRKATPAAVAGCLTPAAIYGLAEIMARYQDEVDHSLAVKYAFFGMLAYVCFTGSIGMVALMTANDQMVRVTWIIGTPLKYRWLREDEREAFDRVAQAWGFSESNKRGFEEGYEWELLREVVSRKGMYLDNPTLMEGME